MKRFIKEIVKKVLPHKVYGAIQAVKRDGFRSVLLAVENFCSEKSFYAKNEKLFNKMAKKGFDIKKDLSFSIKDSLPRWERFLYIKKKFRPLLDLLPCYSLDGHQIEREKIVWVAWLQGEKNMPAICKACLSSIKKNYTNNGGGYRVTLVTLSNVFELIKIPQAIIDKYNKGIIPHAHFSDMIRVCLLAIYGGIWMDATVFCASPLPEELLDKPLFMFRHLWRGDDSITNSNWLISACKNHPVMCLVRDLLFEYWKRYDYLCDYFIAHFFFTLVFEAYPEYLNAMPIYSNVPPHIMQIELFRPYNEERWNEILKMSPVHKLTHKISEELVDKEGTFYKHILEECR